jgi:hypothetical protein
MEIEWKNPNREVIDGSENKELNESDESIVTSNLQKMDSEMEQVLLKESMGGNAGTYVLNGEDCVCAGVNGYLDADTGEIICFGNIQDLDRDMIKGRAHFIFRIARPMKSRPQIVELIESAGFENLTPRAKDIVVKCVNTWNKN